MSLLWAQPRAGVSLLCISAPAHRILRRLRALEGRPSGSRPVPEPTAPRHDSWLQAFWGTDLGRLDAACAGAEVEALEQFRGLDSHLWALLLTQDYDVYPNIKSLLPEVPDRALQATWNGASGAALAGQSVAFYDKLQRLYGRHGTRSLADSRVLDFGCGWGRLTRFLARDLAPGNLFGCDPVQAILDVAQACRVPARLARCDFLPEQLPFGERFDLVYAFSVFTHLSEPAHRVSLEALHAALRPDGLLVATIRPPEYLRLCELLHPALASLGPRAERRLRREALYVFAPHNGQPLGAPAPDGQITYGEAVVTAEYVREQWTEWFELVGFDLLIGDPYQVVVTLRRRDRGEPELPPPGDAPEAAN